MAGLAAGQYPLAAASECRHFRLNALNGKRAFVMDFTAYLADIPLLHSWDDGKTWVKGGFWAPDLAAIHELAVSRGNDAVILETGAGNSTIAFLYANPGRLISICPDRALFLRIFDFCKKNGIATIPWQHFIDRSEWALPNLARSSLQVDLALIDGGHGWPTVFVDFCYIYYLLKREGILLVDDIHLHSIKELARLLSKDHDRFALVKDLGKLLAFKKLTEDRFLPEWGGQPYIVEQTRRSESAPFELF